MNGAFNFNHLGEGESLIHKLHPASKMLFFLFLIISNSIIKDINYSLCISVACLLILLVAKVKLKKIIKGYLLIMMMMCWFMLTLIIFTGLNKHIIFTVWANFTGFGMPILYIIFTSPILSTLYGLEWILTPLKYIRVPVNGIILISTITINFIPILLNEVTRILYTMAARGADIRYVKLHQKFKIIKNILVPLLVSSLNKCETLASAITVKNYDAWADRTNILEQKWYSKDTIFITCAIILVYISFKSITML